MSNEHEFSEGPEAGGVIAPLSSGAGRALGSVLTRLFDARPLKRGRSAPGLGLVLGADEDLAEAAAEEADDRARDRDAKKARIAFEALARVIPDAATGAQTEKRLKETATRGVVALFNAVSKAQKGAVPEEAHGKKKGAAVSKEGFMNLLREGVAKGVPSERVAQGLPTEGLSSSDEEPERGATWMKDDYMTKGSRKGKDWNRQGEADSSSEEGDASSSESIARAGAGSSSDDDDDSSERENLDDELESESE